MKEGQNSIEDKDRPARPKIGNTLKMVDLVNVVILAVWSSNKRHFWTTRNFCGYSTKLCMITLFLKCWCQRTGSYTAAWTVETICQFGWEQLPYPPSSSDLALSDFHLFGFFKKFLHAKFLNDDEVKNTVRKWLKTWSKNFYVEGLEKLVFWKEKSVLQNRKNIEKQNFFPG